MEKKHAERKKEKGKKLEVRQSAIFFPFLVCNENWKSEYKKKKTREAIE